MSLPGPYTAAQQQRQPSNSRSHSKPPHYPRPNSAGPRLWGKVGGGGTATHRSSSVGAANTTATTITGALERASLQQTQYGFGPKHVVPGCPPPEKRGAGSARGSAASSPLMGPSSTRTSPITTSGGANGVPHQGEAYERKKQRAKAARVKLNESIERLSIAIHLAGTQSKQRRTQWQALPVASNNSNADTNRQASLGLLQECMQVAESAKKWDRPSFVGAAASLIQGYVNYRFDIFDSHIALSLTLFSLSLLFSAV